MSILSCLFVCLYVGIPFLPSNFSVVVNASQRGFWLSWIPGFSVTNENVTYVLNVGGAPQPISQTGIGGSSVFVSSATDTRLCPQYNFSLHSQNAVGFSNGVLTTSARAPTGKGL